MNSVLIETAVGNRLVASAATEAVTVQGVWSTVAPPAIEVKQGSDPVIIFSLLSGTPDDTFVTNGIRCVYRVHIFDHRMNGTASAKALFDAVIGNGTPTTAPTKGLHRWQGAVAGMSISQARYTNFAYGHRGDVLEYIADFEIYAEEA